MQISRSSTTEHSPPPRPVYALLSSSCRRPGLLGPSPAPPVPSRAILAPLVVAVSVPRRRGDGGVRALPLPHVRGAKQDVGCPGLRLLEKDIQHIRLNIVRVGDDGTCADLGRNVQWQWHRRAGACSPLSSRARPPHYWPRSTPIFL